MKRFSAVPRDGWRQLIEETGIVFSDVELPDGTHRDYWRENAYYALTMPEVLGLETAAKDIFKMLIAAGDWIEALPPKKRTRFLEDKMRIPRVAHKAVLDTWADDDDTKELYGCQSVYGRFDFLNYGPGRKPQMYEFNAQTATCLPEAAYAQYEWMQQTDYGSDQWNSIWERLVEAWRRNLYELGRRKLNYNGYDTNPDNKPTVHFIYSNGESSGEDLINVTYMADACEAAGYNVHVMSLERMFIAELDGRVYTPIDDDEPMREDYEPHEIQHLDVAFLLYPWEFIWDTYEHEPSVIEALFADMENVGKFDEDGTYIGGTVWFEAPYKMLWSNKAILPLLWMLFGDDPEKSQYLIPAWFKGEEPADLKDWVEKPVFAREGASIKTYLNGELTDVTAGIYGSDDPRDYIVQAYAPPLSRDDGSGTGTLVYPIAGVWMIDGEPAGLGIREDETSVTTNLGYFVPHVITELDDPLASAHEPAVVGSDKIEGK